MENSNDDGRVVRASVYNEYSGGGGGDLLGVIVCTAGYTRDLVEAYVARGKGHRFSIAVCIDEEW